MPGVLQDRDVQHTEHARLQQLIREIRSQPGLEGFMRGSSPEELIKAASTHPVVLLVAKDKECRALVIRSSNAPLSSIQLPGVDPLQLQDIVKKAIRYRNVLDWTANDDDDDDPSRTMGARQPPLGGMLAILWKSIVKPILDHLNIQVSIGVCQNLRLR
jgi:hypothetical protein